ncbi:MAG TPA: diacylglycerol kinase family protein [Bradyrhizobium sp.]|nr:diacylglycerol kinase family protein [Bradyrhizobium sp.]
MLNSSSGTTAEKKRDDMRAKLEAVFRKHAISASFEFVPGSQLQAAAERAVKSAAAREIDAIVAGGGDGTIHTVASAVAGTDIPLGIIPLGTLNHFAKDLKIPLAVEDAVAVISGGVHRSVDVGEVNGEIFINNSSIGIYPYVVLDRDRRRKGQRLSKWPAMIMAGFRAFWNLPLHRLRIRAQNWQEACRSPCVFIGNNEYHLKGSSFGSRERLDGGELCLFVARQQGRLALLWVAVRCVAGLVDQSDLRTVATPAVEVSSRRKRLLVAFDGEIQWMQTPLHYRIRPAAIRVLVPLPAHR